MNLTPRRHTQERSNMDYTGIVLTVAAVVVGLLYLQRRRARLSRDERD